MPNDYVKNGFSQGCPGCAWAQNQMGPRRGHSELCRRRLEEEIAKDDNDKRADKVKERQDHYVAQKVEEGEDAQRDQDPRQDDEPNNEDKDNGQEDVDDDMKEDETLIDAPGTKSEARFRSPERKKASTRVVL